jgi:hypothetical protein
MHTKKTVQLFAFLISIFLLSDISNGGGSGGGGAPPALEISNEIMSTLRTGTIEGDLIRLTRPGMDPMYLEPDILSITSTSINAKALPSGEITTFYIAPQAEKTQKMLSLNLARSLKAMSGMLPILPEDVTIKQQTKVERVKVDEIDADMTAVSVEPGQAMLRPQLIIETVNVGEIDNETLQRISAPGNGTE